MPQIRVHGWSQPGTGPSTKITKEAAEKLGKQIMEALPEKVSVLLKQKEPHGTNDQIIFDAPQNQEIADSFAIAGAINDAIEKKWIKVQANAIEFLAISR